MGVGETIGVDPPKWHDVSSILEDNSQLLPQEIETVLPTLCRISTQLRKERELSFYGDEDFIPSEKYDESDAREAMEWCDFVMLHVEPFLTRGSTS